MCTRVMIVEDSDFFGNALEDLLNDMPGYELVGRALSRSEALALAPACAPEIVILDLSISDRPGGPSSADHGIATIRDLCRLAPPPHVLVLSFHEELMWIQAVETAGARGFVSKHELQEQKLVKALDAIAAGFEVFPPRKTLPPLSKRELDVLRLLHEGLSNKQIAEQLHISEGTVRKHVQHLSEAFGASSRGQVVAAARRSGLL